MRYLLTVLLLVFALSFPIAAADGNSGSGEEVKTFDFDAADITGNKTKPAGSRVNALRNTKMKTKIKPREHFLPELSNSIDEL